MHTRQFAYAYVYAFPYCITSFPFLNKSNAFGLIFSSATFKHIRLCLFLGLH